MVNLTIDGVPISSAEKGKTILEVALENGVYIPYLCHHPELKPAGFCRVCMVDVKGKLVASCRTPIAEGMEVITKSPELDRYRRAIVGAIIAEHDADCLSCEKNLSCKLQEVAQSVGIEGSQRKEMRDVEMDKPVDDSHPWIVRNYNRCIMCGICVRTCDEIQQINAIDYAFRGRETKISTLGDKPLTESNCVSCGECVARCPVGALVPKKLQADQDVDPAVMEKIQAATVTITPSAQAGAEVGAAAGTVTEEVKLIIDDMVVSVAKGSTVLQAAQKAGIYIPYLCYHPELKGSGGCKVCTVDVGGKLLPSCAAPAREGTVVVTNSPQVQEAQAAAVKKMLAGHRGECLNCAKNGRCKLQEIANFTGVYLEMVTPEPLMEVDESNSYFLIDRSRCVTCGVCIRACKQIKGADALEFKRVDNIKKVLHKEGIDLAELGCESCGACVARCPVGALLPKGKETPFMRVPPCKCVC
ncbi:MAG: 2Fe-2S iron-sulfur cluster-binding protein [Firmicutes bacterium]|nr:2Fe-2S iron-sulfur cluster-binding protein [Bacillota bacterium]